ncbi:MAG TPA: c-type cytochrome domain-containing protein, partial [Lacipirellula sp.]
MRHALQLLLNVGGRAALALGGVVSAIAELNAAGPAALAPEAVEFFESRIRPVLVEHCYECHSGEAAILQAELRLDTAAHVQKGGQSGPLFEAGKAADSLLISALRYESYEMPPNGKLPDAVIADFEQWIAMGAPDSRTEDPAAEDGGVGERKNPKDHWSLKKPQKPAAPPVEERSWPRTVIDSFVLARLEDEGLHPSPEADPRTLLRRLSFDLTGLPP